MRGRALRLDMTMMYAVHDALRRDLVRIARATAGADDDPRRILTAAAGWEQFKGFLQVHHTSEDEALWPVMQRALAGRPDDLALLAAMEAEHAAIDPLLESIDAALGDRDSGHERLGELVDGLVTGLTGHLRHEENEALPLIDATLSEQEWQHFSEVNRDRIGAATPRYLPWVLDGAGPESTALILGRLPEPLRNAYQEEWRPAYIELSLWGARVAAV